MMKVWIISVSIVLLLVSCKKEDEAIIIDEALISYFEAFKLAGADRGFDLSQTLDNIEGILADIPDANVSGQCQYREDAPNRIMIDVNYWYKMSNLEREFLVFHELGHCVLNRSHLDDKNADGTCKSIMHSGNTNCINNYSLQTKEQLWDELFIGE